MEVYFKYELGKQESQIIFGEVQTIVNVTLQNAEEIARVADGEVYIDCIRGNSINDLLTSKPGGSYMYDRVKDMIINKVKEKVKEEKSKEITIDVKELNIREEYEKIKEEEAKEEQERKERKERVKRANEIIEKVKEILNKEGFPTPRWVALENTRGTDWEKMKVEYTDGMYMTTKSKDAEEIAREIKEKMIETELEKAKEVKENYKRLVKIVSKLVNREELEEDLREEEGEEEEQELTREEKEFLINKIFDC